MTVLVLICIAVIGVCANQVGFCFVRMVARLRDGYFQPILALLFCAVFCASIVQLSLSTTEVEHFSTVRQLSLFTFVGGLIFGVGANINGGCSVSTLNQFSQGDTLMLATMLGWGLSWTLPLGDLHIWDTTTAVYTSLKVKKLLVAGCSLSLIYVLASRKANKKLWLLMALISASAALAFTVEPNWTPSSFIKLNYLAISSHWQQAPTLLQWALFVTLTVSMFVSSWLSKRFKLHAGKVNAYFKHLLAGVVMGAGARLAGGGNDYLLLVELPQLSGAAALSLLGIVLGIYLSQVVTANKA